MVFVGVDIGGTFTDLIACDENSRRVIHAKSLTTPHDPVEGVIDCIRKSGLDPASVTDLIHGSTIAINTLIEHKGAKVGLLVTQGTRDVYLIGRGSRPEAYNLFFRRVEPLTPRRRIFEIVERLLAGGEVMTPLAKSSVKNACDAMTRDGIDAVAVCFLHSYGNPVHERETGEIVAKSMPDAYLSLSHEIMREYREYERMSTTVVNAYIGPKVAGYVRNLQSRLATIGVRGNLAIMQSNGGVMSPETAIKRPVMMMESGPVGGIIASAETGRSRGIYEVIAFDMGGTTAKASLVGGGEPTTAEGYYVGGYASGHPVMVPVVDVVEVGAGGGSIAWIDEVGALKVGPQSAGAVPGPIAYARGGAQPTITDANVVLGRIGATDFLGGEMRLDREAALSGIESSIGRPLGISGYEAALAIIDIAIAKMSLAVREVSVAKGYDPRDFALVASGGAGPPHAVAIARELAIPTVIIPVFPSHFSALGMLMADERHDFVRTFYAKFELADFAKLRAIAREMEEEARGLATASDMARFQVQFDLRYVGQEFTLPVPVTAEQLRDGDRTAIRRSFDELHERRYAHHSQDEKIEIVNIRLIATRSRPKLALPRLSDTAIAKPCELRPVYFQADRAVECPVYARAELPSGAELKGPALVSEYGSTTVIFADDRMTVADTGELIISVGNDV